MNSHFGFEFGSNCVVGNVDFNANMYQGWNTPRWEEPQGIDHSYWQQPPDTYRYNFHPNACQLNGYGDPFCDNQPPYAYEPYPQHDAQPYSQVPYHQNPPYDPNPYPPYPPPYEPYEPYMEPPPFQHNYSQEPPQYTPSPYSYQDEPTSNYETSFLNNEPSVPPPPFDEASML